MENLLDFAIVFTWKCNLSCTYCPLTHEDQEISYETLDSYIDFFYKNQDFLQKHFETLELLLFGGEPFLVFEKIQYFIDKMLPFPIKTVFKIYTNVTKLSPEIGSYITSIPHYKDKIILYLSIDGDKNSMLQNRLSHFSQFDKIIENVSLLKKKAITFNISKVISEKTSNDILNSLMFIHSLAPKGIYLYPAGFGFYDHINKQDMIGVIRGLDQFIQKLISIGYSKNDIRQYINIDDYVGKSLKEQIDVGIIGDWDGAIYGILQAISIFKTHSTFNIAQKDAITLGTVNEHNSILSAILEYENTKDRLSLVGVEWYQENYPNELDMFHMLNKYFSLRFL